MTDRLIDRHDMRIVMWIARDGTAYRAAVCEECALTGPEHATLSDDALLDEAEREARRASLYQMRLDGDITIAREDAARAEEASS